MSIDENRHLSDLVPNRLPEFVRVDHPTLVAFLSAYYEWLDLRRNEGLILSPMAMRDIPDVDRTMDQFVAKFKKEYLFQFPETLAVSKDTGLPVDERKLVKNIKQFYRAKGTEKSYEFLFRILYDTAVEFYYPKTDILQASSGKWVQNNYLRVSNDLGDTIYRVAGNNIVQRDRSGKVVATARVISVTVYQKGNFTVAELLITGRNGTFRTESEYSLEFNDGLSTYRERKVYSVISSVNITDGGEGYRPGDKITFVPASGDSGQRAYGTVTEVNSAGTIQKIKIEDFGINYDVTPQKIEIETLRGNGFIGTAVVGSLCKELGYYANNDGRLSTNKVLQDNHFYQNWSYVLKAEVVIDKYREAIRRLVHPAGTAMFGSVLVKRCTKNNLGNSVTVDSFDIPYIGNYTPYTFNTHDDLTEWFGPTDGYNPILHDPLIKSVIVSGQVSGNPVSNQIVYTITSEPLGSTGASGFTGPEYSSLMGDPYWFIYQHPNKHPSVSGEGNRHIARVWSNQVSDFTEWDEWVMNSTPYEEVDRLNWISGLTFPPPQENCCVGKDGQIVTSYGVDLNNDPLVGVIRHRPENSFKYGILRYSENTQFRKITMRSFFEMDNPAKGFDCRTESGPLYGLDNVPSFGYTSIQDTKDYSVVVPSLEQTIISHADDVGYSQDRYRVLELEYNIVDWSYISNHPNIAGVLITQDNGIRLYDYSLFENGNRVILGDLDDGVRSFTLSFFDRRRKPIRELPSKTISFQFNLLLPTKTVLETEILQNEEAQ